MKGVVVAALLLVSCSAFAKTPPSKTNARPWLGMGLLVRTATDGKKFLYVARVPNGTPAHRAGFADGDLVTAINGKTIAFTDDLDVMEFVGRLKPGSEISFTAVRSGKVSTLRVVVGELPIEYEQRWRESLEKARAERARRESRRAR